MHQQTTEPASPIVILVHGFNKGPRDMQQLARGLEKAGFQTVSVNLPTRFGSIQACVETLDKQLTHYVQGNTPLHFVAHSMGGLIVRLWWQQHSNYQPEHSVFIATPHGGSPLAAFALRIPGYGLLFKPAHALLPGAGFAKRSHQNIPISGTSPVGASMLGTSMLGIIAGTQSFGILARCCLDKPNDGRVEVKAVQCNDADQTIELPYNHKNIHHQAKTVQQVAHFLIKGQFYPQ